MGTQIAETGNLGLEYADLTWELLLLRLRFAILGFGRNRAIHVRRKCRKYLSQNTNRAGQ